ncbi:MAG: hypothetical protein AAGI22_09845 [Planctomycetota bacterium]
MKLSGFTFLRNGSKLYYPIVESIRSALPIVDEFVIALGDSDPDDDTRARIEALGSDKIRIFDTVWDLERFSGGTEYAHQTDLAKEHCTGDWLLYVQGDEVLHEDDLPTIVASCERWLDHPGVDALLFDYLHFWGDYDHVHDNHRWYKQEVRIIRNDPEIHSIRDAQSFRRISGFDGVSYGRKEGTQKLVAVHSGARIFHYGWVRPPKPMGSKVSSFCAHHEKEPGSERESARDVAAFDYGPLGAIPRFEGSHPAVMRDRIASMDWAGDLDQSSRVPGRKPIHPHERPKYRLMTWFERTFFGGRHLFASRNYQMLPGVPLPRKRNAATPRSGADRADAAGAL